MEGQPMNNYKELFQRTFIRPVHKDSVEQAQKDGWEFAEQLSINPDYVVMTKPVED